MAEFCGVKLLFYEEVPGGKWWLVAQRKELTMDDPTADANENVLAARRGATKQIQLLRDVLADLTADPTRVEVSSGPGMGTVVLRGVGPISVAQSALDGELLLVEAAKDKLDPIMQAQLTP